MNTKAGLRPRQSSTTRIEMEVIDSVTMLNSSRRSRRASSISVRAKPAEVDGPEPQHGDGNVLRKISRYVTKRLSAYAMYIGPGILVSIAYMDPGNYSTDVAAGASKKYALLFVILLSNLLALYLQTLAIKLGTVTGCDLAENCRLHLPKWLGLCIYVLAEAAMIATDVAEVIGSAIALNILMKIPLIAGVCLTAADVMLVLLAYRPGKGMNAVRIFEYCVSGLVFGVVICLSLVLSKLPEASVGPIFRGFLPSSDILKGDAMYIGCGILGATVMPHSLYLGSSLVLPRIRDYDAKVVGHYDPEEFDDKYRPSYQAIQATMKYSVVELAVSLCIFALFANSALLIIAAGTLYGTPGALDADLYGIYDMLCSVLSKAAGVLFMVALLFSGQSAGVICTIAGQIVCEGHINWKMKPWVRRLITRLIAILPCIVIVAAIGKQGLSAALNASQVALSILLPFLAAPLIYLTSKKSIMTVEVPCFNQNNEITHYKSTEMANGWFSITLGIAIWLFITVLNVYLIVHLAIFGQ